MNVRERIQELNPEAIFIADMDNAIVGMTERENSVFVAIYDIEKCADIMMKRDNKDYEEAIDDIYYNTVYAYLGINTPIFATMFCHEEESEKESE
jgi:hypothetical protein